MLLILSLDMYGNDIDRIKYPCSLSHTTFFSIYHNVLFVTIESGNKCKVNETFFLINSSSKPINQPGYFLDSNRIPELYIPTTDCTESDHVNDKIKQLNIC